jgi:hypothetical protein
MKSAILVSLLGLVLIGTTQAYHNSTILDQGASCNINCETCVSAKNCTACKTGYYLKYESCFACGSKCASCTTNTKCKLCVDGYHLNGGLCYSNQKTTGLIAILVIGSIVIIVLLIRVCKDCKRKSESNSDYRGAIGTVPNTHDPHHVNVHKPVLPQYMNPMSHAQVQQPTPVGVHQGQWMGGAANYQGGYQPGAQFSTIPGQSGPQYPNHS